MTSGSQQNRCWNISYREEGLLTPLSPCSHASRGNIFFESSLFAYPESSLTYQLTYQPRRTLGAACSGVIPKRGYEKTLVPARSYSTVVMSC